MTLNQFLDVAYALLVDEYRRLGSSLTEAFGHTREYAAGYRPVTAGGNEGAVPPARAAVSPGLSAAEIQNEQALKAFEEMMGGVQFA